MTTVAITGVSGYLGRTLVRVLDEIPAVTRIIGIDRTDPGFTAKNFEFYSFDVREPGLAGVIDGADVVVHLAAVHDDPDEIMDNNVGGTRSVVDAAERAGVRQLIFASSDSVYGAHADNEHPLTESSPVRPNPENVYALSKTEAEQVVAYFAEAHPDVAVATLRLPFIGGPTLPRRNAPFLEPNVRFVIEGYDAPMQAVHEQDAAEAVSFVLSQNLRGVFNVCADDAVSAPERIFGQRRVALPVDRARRVLERTSRIGLSPSAVNVADLMYARVLSNAALREAGFTPGHTSEQTLRESAALRREYMSVGPITFKRRSAALIGGTIGVLALVAARGRRVRRAKA
jgi:UDP-glucose 4-epimerase